MSEFTSLNLASHDQSSVPKANRLLQPAVNYATKYGIPVIPLHGIGQAGKCTCGKPCLSPGKHPITKNGLKDASTELKRVSRWWLLNPNANIGIVTGKLSNIVVLDIDAKSGGYESLNKLTRQNGALKGHALVQTGGGGLHFYFSCSGKEYKNRCGILPGIDFKGEGGYVVAPPSRHISGDDYEWSIKRDLQPMPEWLQKLVLNKKQDSDTTMVSNTGSHVPSGTRNTFLVSLGGFLKAKGITGSALNSFLAQSNEMLCKPSLEFLEVNNICKSLANYDDWKKPKPLPRGNITLTPITDKHLPNELKPWILDVCGRMQLPLEYVATPAIITAATLVGRKLAVKPLQNDDWTVIPNLWGFLVAEPGSMKSAGLHQALLPLTKLERKAQTRFKKELEDVNTKTKNLATKIESLKQAIKLDWQQGLANEAKDKENVIRDIESNRTSQPKEKRYKTNDPTIEKLALIFQANPSGVLLFRDELSGWLESIAKSGREGSREFYLEAWNGNGSFSIDRIGRGTIHTESLCLSVFGGIQPEKLEKYFKKYESAYGRDGFVERFQLAVYPDARSSFELIDEKPDPAAFDRAMKLFECLDQLPLKENTPTIAHFDEKSQPIANKWRTELEIELLGDSITTEEKSYLSKYRSLMPSLALIFACCNRGNCEELRYIDIESTKLAISWCSILRSHMRKILNMSTNPVNSAKRIIEAIKSGEIYSGQKTRDIYRKGWSGLKNPAQAGIALGMLEEHGYLKRFKDTSAGKVSETIILNPMLGGEL